MSNRSVRTKPAKAALLLLVAAGIVQAIIAAGVPAAAGVCDSAPSGSPSSSSQPSSSPSQSSSPLPTVTLPGGIAQRPAARPGDPVGLPSILPSDSPSPSPSPSHGGTQDAGGCPVATTITLAASKPAAVWGTRFVFTGSVSCSVAVDPVDVVLQRRFVGESAWRAVTAHATDDHYGYRLEDVPSRSADYRVAYTPSSTTLCEQATSAPVRIGVRPGITLTPSASSMRAGNTVRLGGKVLPAHPGKRVTLQVLTGDGWRTAATGTLDSSSAYAFAFRRTSRGSLVFRIGYATQDADHLWNVSRNIRVSWS